MKTRNPKEEQVSNLKDDENQIASLQRQVVNLQEQLRTLKANKQRHARVDKGEQALRLAEVIIDNSPAILFRRRAAEELKDRKMVYVSPNISRFGYEAEDFLEDRIMFRQIVNPEDHAKIAKEIQEYTSKGIEDYSQTYRIVTQNGELRWVEDRTSIIEDEITGEKYHQGIIVDVHERKEAEEKLRRSEEKYRRIVDTAGEGFILMDADLCIVDMNTAFARMVGKKREELYGTNPLSGCDREYRAHLAESEEKGAGHDYFEFECELLNEENAVPVLVHANTLRSDSGAIIGNMAFITDMTQQKKALQLAGEVQRSLLPTEPPKIVGVEIASRNIPCDEVGGDYFDFLPDKSGKPGRLSLVVGDITGHGVDAALLMTSARSLLRMRAAHGGSPVDIVTAMNQHLTKDLSESGRFMTMLYLDLDRKKEQIEWVRAGHDPALIYDPDTDAFEELKGVGLALGVMADYEFVSQYRYGLKPGQIIVLGTDGIWESCNLSGELFGKERLMAIVRQMAAHDANTLLERVFQELSEFTDGSKAEDDLTLVIVKIQAD